MYTYIVYKVIFILILNYEIAIVQLYDMLVLGQAEIFCLGNYHPGVKINCSQVTLFLGKILLCNMNNYLYGHIMLFSDFGILLFKPLAGAQG